KFIILSQMTKELQKCIWRSSAMAPLVILSSPFFKNICFFKVLQKSKAMNSKPRLCQCGCGGIVNHSYLKGHHRRGKTSHWWKGGRTLSSDGYVMIWMPEHKRAHKGYIAEHIVIMELAIGRDILPTECVHHINQIRWDNYIGNLILFYSHIIHLAYHR